MERRMPACLHHAARVLWCSTGVVWSLLTQASSSQSPSLKSFRSDECVWLQAAHYRKPLVLVMTFRTWRQESTKLTTAIRLSSLRDLGATERQIFRLPSDLCKMKYFFLFSFILLCQEICRWILKGWWMHLLSVRAHCTAYGSRTSVWTIQIPKECRIKSKCSCPSWISNRKSVRLEENGKLSLGALNRTEQEPMSAPNFLRQVAELFLRQDVSGWGRGKVLNSLVSV